MYMIYFSKSKVVFYIFCENETFELLNSETLRFELNPINACDERIRRIKV